MGEEIFRALPVDTEGAPVITKCVVEGCLSLDLDLFAPGAPGVWIFTCGAGHFAFVTAQAGE